MREILDRVAEHLVVADDRLHVIRRIDGRRKQAQFGDGSGDAGHGHEIADLHRPQHDQECARRKMREQARPRHADGNTARRDQGGEGRGLDAEITKNANHQQDIQGHRDDRADIAQNGGIDFLAFKRRTNHTDHDTDQPAADDPECDCRQNLDADLGSGCQK